MSKRSQIKVEFLVTPEKYKKQKTCGVWSVTFFKVTFKTKQEFVFRTSFWFLCAVLFAREGFYVNF